MGEGGRQLLDFWDRLANGEWPTFDDAADYAIENTDLNPIAIAFVISKHYDSDGTFTSPHKEES